MHFLSTFLTGILVTTAHAQNIWQQYALPMGGSNLGGRFFIISFSFRVANFFFLILAGGAVLAIMQGSFGMILSFGDESKKEEAKKILLYAVMGLVLAVMAQGLLQFAKGVIEGIMK